MSIDGFGIDGAPELQTSSVLHVVIVDHDSYFARQGKEAEWHSSHHLAWQLLCFFRRRNRANWALEAFSELRGPTEILHILSNAGS